MIQFDNKTTLLVLTPHADDEALGCSGLIKKVKDAGGKVYVLLFTLGEIAKFNEEYEKVKSSDRLKEFTQAMEFLEVDGWDILLGDEDHLKLDAFPRIKLVSLIENGHKYSLNQLKPSILSVCAPSFNQDHQAVYEAAMTACRPPYPGRKHVPPIILTYEYPSINWSLGDHRFTPNFYIDLSNSLKDKLKAVEIYKTQIGCPEYSISVEAVKIMSYYRGREMSINAAEAFEIKRCLYTNT